MNVYEANTIIIPGGSVKRILDSNGVVIWSKYPKSKLEEPFYIENRGTTEGTIAFKGERAITVYYSSDKVSWQAMSPTGSTSWPIKTINPGERFYFRASAVSGWKDHTIAQDTSFTRKGSMYIGGNIMSLLYGSDFASKTTLMDDAFQGVFSGWNGLSGANDLILPATTLSSGCYEKMFYNSSLRGVAPALPATTLASSCYHQMFGYTSITKMPELPATTLASGCYYQMFYNCSSLREVRCAAKINITNTNVYHWLDNVASNGVFYKAAGVTWSSSYLPSSWTVVDL